MLLPSNSGRQGFVRKRSHPARLACSRSRSNAQPVKITTGRVQGGLVLLECFGELESIHRTRQFDVGDDDVRGELEREAKAVGSRGRLQCAVPLPTEPLGVHFPFVPRIADEQDTDVAAHAVSFARRKNGAQLGKTLTFLLSYDYCLSRAYGSLFGEPTALAASRAEWQSARRRCALGGQVCAWRSPCALRLS